MLKNLALIVALAGAPVVAQTQASVVPYGSPCSPTSSAPALSWQGLPQLGTTFSIYGQGCAFGTNSFFTSFVVGFSQTNTIFPGNGCPILVSPDLLHSYCAFSFAVPNQPSLAGVQFNVQAATSHSGFLSPTYIEFSDALQCTVGY